MGQESVRSILFVWHYQNFILCILRYKILKGANEKNCFDYNPPFDNNDREIINNDLSPITSVVYF